MGKHQPFLEERTLEQRQEESKTILTKYPDRVPSIGISDRTARNCSLRMSLCQKVMIERYSMTDLPDIEKNKFLVPRDMSVGQFIHILTRRLQLSPGKALVVFVNNTLPQTASLMGSVYSSFKDEDGFLYMCYSTEKTFG
ncbi:Autophagy-related protein 8D [Hibiscus syriacus]|uniref:Autophagy-related protein n=1 Tax=Hibiscus syriacus TaxID=106335 RepID=A0A6A3CXT3_HIBSY|nr:Autophagy-related protein 8D [Hibiscus syriacus]